MATLNFEAKTETTLSSIKSNGDVHPDYKRLIEQFDRDLDLDGQSAAPR